MSAKLIGASGLKPTWSKICCSCSGVMPASSASVSASSNTRPRSTHPKPNASAPLTSSPTSKLKSSLSASDSWSPDEVSIACCTASSVSAATMKSGRKAIAVSSATSISLPSYSVSWKSSSLCSSVARAASGSVVSTMRTKDSGAWSSLIVDGSATETSVWNADRSVNASAARSPSHGSKSSA